LILRVSREKTEAKLPQPPHLKSLGASLIRGQVLFFDIALTETACSGDPQANSEFNKLLDVKGIPSEFSSYV